MSQRLTEDVVRGLKKGDILYNNVIEFTREDGSTYPATATVIGRPTFGGVERWVLTVHRNYGAFADGHIGGLGGSELWRTVPEKIVPTHVHRVRRPAPSVHSEPEQEEESQPVHRVRRSRPVAEEVEVTPTGRIRRSRDVHNDLLDNAQEQLNTLRRRRTRSG